jgi:hypothetical protein
MNDNTAKNLRNVFLSGAHTYVPPQHYDSEIIDFKQQILSISDYLSKTEAYKTFNTCKATLKIKARKIKKRAIFIATGDGVIVIGRVNNQITDFVHENPIIYVCYFSDDKTEHLAHFFSLPKGKTIKVIYTIDNGSHNIEVESNKEWERIHFNEGFADMVQKDGSNIVRLSTYSKKLPSIKNITCSNRPSVQTTTDEDNQLEQASACPPNEHNFIFYRGKLCLI